MQIGFCKYHRKEEALCKCHILPNAFYKHLRKLGADGFWLNRSGSSYIRNTPGGLYDKNMLCSAADNEMGLYDEYAVSVFKHERPPTIFVDALGREIARIENLDVNLMNLFLLSFIWRCHHAQIEPFRLFNIGPAFEERIRQKLINQNGDSVPWFSYFLTMTYGSINDVVLPLKFPFKEKIEGMNFLFMYFLNFKVIAKLDSRKDSEWLNAVAATPGKPVIVLLQAYHQSNDYQMEIRSLMKLVATGATW